MQKAIAIIKEFEGFCARAYVPPEGLGNGYAIGYGYTRPWVTADCVISKAWAEALLAEELRFISMKISDELSRLNPNQQQAVLSFCYNVGVGAFKQSTMCQLIRVGRTEDAAKEFSRWNKAKQAGVPMTLLGLTRRRIAEQALFESKT